MTVRFDQLPAPVREALLNWERFGRSLSSSDDVLGLVARYDRDAEDALVHTRMLARDHLTRLTAGYELAHRVRAQTAPSNKAFRALSEVFRLLGEWRTEWISGPYQTVGSDGTLLLHGKPVGLDSTHAAKLGVAGSVVVHPKGMEDAFYLGRFGEDNANAFVTKDRSIHFYKINQLVAIWDAGPNGTIEHARREPVSDWTALLAAYDAHLSSRPPAPARGEKVVDWTPPRNERIEEWLLAGFASKFPPAS